MALIRNTGVYTKLSLFPSFPSSPPPQEQKGALELEPPTPRLTVLFRFLAPLPPPPTRTWALQEDFFADGSVALFEMGEEEKMEEEEVANLADTICQAQQAEVQNAVLGNTETPQELLHKGDPAIMAELGIQKLKGLA